MQLPRRQLGSDGAGPNQAWRALLLRLCGVCAGGCSRRRARRRWRRCDQPQAAPPSIRVSRVKVRTKDGLRVRLQRVVARRQLDGRARVAVPRHTVRRRLQISQLGQVHQALVQHSQVAAVGAGRWAVAVGGRARRVARPCVGPRVATATHFAWGDAGTHLTESPTGIWRSPAASSSASASRSSCIGGGARGGARDVCGRERVGGVSMRVRSLKQRAATAARAHLFDRRRYGRRGDGARHVAGLPTRSSER